MVHYQLPAAYEAVKCMTTPCLTFIVIVVVTTVPFHTFAQFRGNLWHIGGEILLDILFYK